MQIHSLDRVVLLALIFLIPGAAAFAGAPWYWDGTTNEWDADYPGDNHWLDSFGGADNANLPSGNWNALYVRDGKVSFSDTAYLGVSGSWNPQSGVMGTEIKVTGGEAEWNDGICDSVYSPTVDGSYSIPGTITVKGGLFGAAAGQLSGTIGTDGIFNLEAGTLTKWLFLNGNTSLSPTRAVVNLRGGTSPGATINHGVVYQTTAGVTDVNNPSYGTTTGLFSSASRITIGTRQHWDSTQAYYYLGDAAGNTGTISGTGTLTVGGKANWGDAPVTATVMKAGLIGYGTVSIATLDNNRQVVADGYGVERTLDLSGVSTINNTYLNGVTAYLTNDVFRSVDGSDGWYARNKGKLTLPTLNVAGGTSTRNWGEPESDSTIDLINSVRMDFNGVTGGPLSISLLAADRDVFTMTDTYAVGVVGMYEFNASGGFDFGGGTVDLTFRYDDLAAGLLPGGENSLQLFKTDSGGTWVPLSYTLDTASNTMSVAGVNSFSYFGVGQEISGSVVLIPEPGVAVLLALGGLLLVRRTEGRRRRAEGHND